MPVAVVVQKQSRGRQKHSLDRIFKKVANFLKNFLTTYKKNDIINISKEQINNSNKRKVVFIMAKKVTIKEQFVEVAEVLRGIDREDLATFIDGRIEVLDKKTASKKPTARQEENAELKAKIAEYLMADGGRYRAGEIAKEFDTTITRVSALLKQMVEDDKTAVREVEKKVAYFSAV
jgi:hypothetical protein